MLARLTVLVGRLLADGYQCFWRRGGESETPRGGEQARLVEDTGSFV